MELLVVLLDPVCKMRTGLLSGLEILAHPLLLLSPLVFAIGSSYYFYPFALT